MASRRIKVEIVGDAASLDRSFKQAGRSAQNFSRTLNRSERGAIAGSGAFKSLGRSVAFASLSFIGAYGFVGAVRKSIAEAGQLETQIARSTTVFGASGDQVHRWSETTYRSLKLASSTALTAANSFGTMLTSMGVGSAQAARLSEQITKVVAAASLARGEEDPAQATKAAMTALAGRGRAFRQYGIILDQVSIKAEALRRGFVKAVGDPSKIIMAQRKLAEAQAELGRVETTRDPLKIARAQDAVTSAHERLRKAVAGNVPALTKQQTALASSSIIIRQGARFVDRYGASLDTAAGRSRAFHQGTEQLREEIGTALLPAFNKGLTSINKWLAAVSEGGPKHKQFVADLAQVKSIAMDAFTAVRDLAKGLNMAAKAVGGWKNAFEIITTLYLANKFLNLAAAIKESRLALIGLNAISGRTTTAMSTQTVAWGKSFNTPLTKLGKLRAALIGLKSIGVITLAIGVSEFIAKKLGVPGPLQDQVKQPGKAPPSFETRGMKPLGGGWYQAGSHFWHWNAQSGKFDKISSSPPASPLFGLKGTGVSAAEIDRRRSAPRPSAQSRSEAAQPTPQMKPPGKPPPPPAPFALPFNLQLQQAQAESINSEKQILAAAKAIRAFILKALPHLKGARLLEAYALLGSANDTIASAAQEAAAKAKAQADAARQKLANARAAMAQAVENVRTQIGELFQGPVLAPTDAQTKARLGVPAPKARDLTKDLRAQTALYARFNRDLAILARRGAPKELLKELRAKGPSDIANVEALTKASRHDLALFFKAFGRRERLVQRVAKVEMRAAQVNIRAARLVLEGLRAHAPARSRPLRKMGEGGVAVGPTEALIGERGREAVIPLSHLGGGDDKPIHVHVELDGREIASVVTTRQQRQTKTSAPQVRGRHYGQVLGTN